MSRAVFTEGENWRNTSFFLSQMSLSSKSNGPLWISRPASRLLRFRPHKAMGHFPVLALARLLRLCHHTVVCLVCSSLSRLCSPQSRFLCRSPPTFIPPLGMGRTLPLALLNSQEAAGAPDAVRRSVGPPASRASSRTQAHLPLPSCCRRSLIEGSRQLLEEGVSFC